MLHLRSVSLHLQPGDAGYPYSVQAVQTMRELIFKEPVTFFVGENGAGKSTLMEAIVCRKR